MRERTLLLVRLVVISEWCRFPPLIMRLLMAEERLMRIEATDDH